MDKRTSDIEKYLKGELTSAEMHALEKRALDDPFLAEALEGAEQLSQADFLKDVAELNEKINKRKTTTWIWPLRIAAGLLLVAVASFIIWNTLDKKTVETLALDQPKTTPDTITSTQTQPLTITPAETQSSSAQTETKEISPAPATEKQPQKTRSKSASENPSEKSKKENRVTTLAREKRLDQKNQVVTIDPSKKNDLQSPSANDIRIAEGYIASVDARPTIVTGLVLSAEDGTPLKDVNVALKGTSVVTKTDAYGRYAILTNNQNKTLVYASEGLESTEVKIQGTDSTYLPVKLEMDEDAQKEAAVEPMGLFDYRPTSVFNIPAHPEKGNRAFKQYLQRNHKYPNEARGTKTEGVVIVEFKVDSKGALTEFRIIRGIGKGCDEELIRLILQGDKWMPTTRDGVPVDDKARVRFKFELAE